MFTMFCCTTDLFGKNWRVRIRVRIMIDGCCSICIHMCYYKCSVYPVCILYYALIICTYTIYHILYTIQYTIYTLYYTIDTTLWSKTGPFRPSIGPDTCTTHPRSYTATTTIY